MAIQKSKEAEVDGTANTEVTATILQGVAYERRRVKAVRPTEITGTLQGDATIVIYKNNEQVHEVDYRHFLDKDGNNTRPVTPPEIPLDIPLTEGDTLAVGHTSGGTASDFTYNAVYQIGDRG